MSAFLMALIIADGFILVLSYVQHSQGWAYQGCQYLIPLCSHPNALIVAAVILIGLHFAMRA
jgi:hypothetical protein